MENVIWVLVHCSAAGIVTGVGTTPGLGLLGATVGLPGVAPSVAPLVPSPLAGLSGIGLAAIQSPGIAAVALPAPMAEPIGAPSEFLLLKNMFDPKTEVSFLLREQVILLNVAVIGNRLYICVHSTHGVFTRRSQILTLI